MIILFWPQILSIISSVTQFQHFCLEVTDFTPTTFQFIHPSIHNRLGQYSIHNDKDKHLAWIQEMSTNWKRSSEFHYFLSFLASLRKISDQLRKKLNIWSSKFVFHIVDFKCIWVGTHPRWNIFWTNQNIFQLWV